MKNNKNFIYPKKDREIKKNLLILRDSAIALNYGRLKNDQRLQITMPSNIVKIVDQLFPGEERNKIFTRAIIDFLNKEIHTNYKFDTADLLRDE